MDQDKEDVVLDDISDLISEYSDDMKDKNWIFNPEKKRLGFIHRKIIHGDEKYCR